MLVRRLSGKRNRSQSRPANGPDFRDTGFRAADFRDTGFRDTDFRDTDFRATAFTDTALPSTSFVDIAVQSWTLKKIDARGTEYGHIENPEKV